MFAESMGIQCLVAESDYLDLVRACRHQIKRGEIMSMVKDIHNIQLRFQKLGLTWVPREGNRVDCHIARLASQYNLPANWTQTLPACLSSLIQKEKNPFSHTMGGSSSGGNRQVQGVERGMVLPSNFFDVVHSRSGFPFDLGWRQGESSGHFLERLS